MKCFACQKMGHYDGQCPQKKKKKKKQTTTSADVENFTVRFESFLFALGMLIDREHPSSPVQMLTDRGSFPA